MLFLHIGTQKTGSSALQHYLASDPAALRKNGIRYVTAGREGTHQSSHRDLVLALMGKVDLSIWEGVRAELAEGGSRIDVISAEGLWFENPAEVRKQLPQQVPLRVVVYLRRQDQYLQSLWKQAVLDGRKFDFENWRERVPFRGDYLATLDRWASEFGAGALVVRPYDHRGKRDTVGDFCELLECQPSTAVTELQRRNSTPRVEIVQFVRALNQLDLEINRVQFRRSLMSRNANYARSCDVLTYEQAVSLMRSYERQNAELVAKYYRDGTTPLFPPLEPYSPAEVWGLHLDEYFQLITDVLGVVTEAALHGSIRKGPASKKRPPS